jgi:NADH-quinone oxidoreductase subunit F
LNKPVKRVTLGKISFGIEGFDFDIKIKEGAGAFVCGEETALIASIEGSARHAPPKTAIPCRIWSVG